LSGAADWAIFVTLAGSQAQGTAGPESDVDLRGVCVAPLSLRLSLFRSFEQEERVLDDVAWREAPWASMRAQLEQHPTAAAGLAHKAESVLYDVAKFLRLCAEGNPNALEILFADERDWVLATPAWRTVYDARHSFLSRKVQQTFLGYGLSQLKRIRSHREWLLHPPASKPLRGDFGLPEAGTFSADDQHRLEEQLAAQLQLSAEVRATLGAEKRYRGALKHWESYQRWQAERNPARAELERRYGYDTKHAMHLVRLMRMGLEVLEHGELRVRRPDAAELREIRAGSLSYDALLAEAERLEQRMTAAAERSSLPADVDGEQVDALFRAVLAL